MQAKTDIRIDFIAGELSLNRNEDFLYTLLVPDRARTLFPVFDQPDLKASYELSLKMPFSWSAMANGIAAQIDTLDGKKALPIRSDETDKHLSVCFYSRGI